MDAEKAQELYRDTFDKRHEDIVALLTRRRLFVKLRYAGALTEAETTRATSSTAAASVIARDVVSLVRREDNLLRYIAFSNVVWRESESIGRGLFPFADQLKGLHRPSKGAPCSEIRPVLPENAILMVWLVTCSDDRDVLMRLLSGRGEGPLRTSAGVQWQLFPLCVDDAIRPVYLCLAMQVATLNPGLVASMLKSFKPAPRIAVLSGTCIANEGDAQIGDVVVVTRSKPWPVAAEVQHMTELWKLQGKLMFKEKRPQSLYNQMVSLARLYLELKSPPEEQTQWFRELGWQADRPLAENLYSFKRYMPDPEKMRMAQESSTYWKPVDDDVLPYAPVGSLLSEAKASMLYGYSCHPLPRHSDTVFGGASYFTSQKGTVVYSPEAVAFYNGAQDSKVDGLKFLAAMGVSEIAKQSAEPEFKTYARHTSTLYMYKVVQYLASKLH